MVRRYRPMGAIQPTLTVITSIGMAVALTVREAVTFIVGMAQRQWTKLKIRSLTMT